MCPDLELQRHEAICSHAITIYHDASYDGELTFSGHPIQMEDGLQELFLDLVHLICERNLLVAGVQYFLRVRLKQMLDAVHLEVVDAVLELCLLDLRLGSGKGPDSGTTG